MTTYVVTTYPANTMVPPIWLLHIWLTHFRFTHIRFYMWSLHIRVPQNYFPHFNLIVSEKKFKRFLHLNYNTILQFCIYPFSLFFDHIFDDESSIVQNWEILCMVFCAVFRQIISHQMIYFTTTLVTLERIERNQWKQGQAEQMKTNESNFE